MKYSSRSTLNPNTAFDKSTLFDEKTFYNAFLNDLEVCRKEIIIESPYITSGRMKTFHSLFLKLLKQDVKYTLLLVIHRSIREE